MADERTSDAAGPVRRRGRPLEFDGTPVSVRLPAALHDDLSREALRRDVDLSQVIRERLSVSRKSTTSQDAAQ